MTPSDPKVADRAVPADAGRLHPWSWLFTLLAFLRQFVVPLVAILLVGGGDWWEWVGLGAAPLLVIAAVIYALTYRYWLEGDALIVRSGVLVRQRRVLKLARIQNIGRRQNVLHRLFGVTELQVESAGGVTSEAHMRVLSVAEADRLERMLREAVEIDEEPDMDAAPALLHLPDAELVRLGLISNRGMLVVGALFAFLAQAGDALEHLTRPLANAVESLFGRFVAERNLDSPATVVGVIFLIVLAVLALRLLSIVVALLVFHGFRLVEHKRRFTAEYGLLNRVRTSATAAKIQKLWVIETLLHRLFGRVTVRVDVAGVEAANEGEGRRMRWLAPLCTPAKARKLASRVLEGTDLDALAWRPVHASARRRLFRRSVLPVLLLSAVAAVWLTPWCLLALLLVPWAWLAARGWAAYSGYAMDDSVFAVRTGWLSRTVAIARRDRTQAVCLRRTPFDRRHGTASLEMEVAGGATSARLRLPFMDADDARLAAAALAALADDPSLSAQAWSHAVPLPFRFPATE